MEKITLVLSRGKRDADDRDPDPRIGIFPKEYN
jgi:hypothetical protein